MSWSAKFEKRTTLPGTALPVDLYTIRGPKPTDIAAIAVDEKNRDMVNRIITALAMSEH